MKKFSLLLVITLISTFFYISEGSAVNRIFGQDLPRIDKIFTPDEIVVKFKEGVREEIIAQLNARFGTSIFKASRLAGFKRLRIPKGRTVKRW